MVKLLLCIFFGLGLAIVMLQLRQQRMELSHQNNVLHNKIESTQAKLWSQQLQIAVYTAPNAIEHTVGSHALKMVPRTPAQGAGAHWMDARATPASSH